jgi:isoquinoline 1-oxidoreductase alpha subunit
LLKRLHMISFFVNNKKYTLDADPSMPLLWVIRDLLGLTGTKFGCGMALCGACTIHLNGEAVRSCVMPLATAEGKQITTIEGVSSTTGKNVQQAWLSQDVPQCGYCQSGQIMSAISLLSKIPNPSDGDIDSAMSGNICRCGTYQNIRKAIHLAASLNKTAVK